MEWIGTTAGGLAVLMYLGAAAAAARGAVSSVRVKLYRWPAALAIVCHAVLIVACLATAQGLSFGVFDAASVVLWITTGSVLATSFRTRIEALSTLLFVLAAIVVGLQQNFRSTHLLIDLSPGLLYHIVLALVAYGLFIVACAEAALVIFADRRLRAHKPVLNLLPPLAEMERSLFQILFIAFALLSYSLVLGAFYVTDLGAQHLYHKVVFAALAWLVFAVLFFGRWRFGWRGVHAARYVLVGMCLLLLSYFGSKSVLELLLGRT